MQCDETISHMVTAGRSYFRTLRNACVTAGKTTMTAGKIYHGCFEMLSWQHRTSANIINTCFWLLETCTKCSYFIEENIRPGAQRLAFEVKYEYIGHRPRTYRWPAFWRWASFQTTGVRCETTLEKRFHWRRKNVWLELLRIEATQSKAKTALLLHELDSNLRSWQYLSFVGGQLSDLSRPDVQNFNRIDHQRSFCEADMLYLWRSMLYYSSGFQPVLCEQLPCHVWSWCEIVFLPF